MKKIILIIGLTFIVNMGIFSQENNSGFGIGLNIAWAF